MDRGGGGAYKTEKEALEESHSLQSFHSFQPTEFGGGYKSRILLSLMRVTTFIHLNKSLF